MKKMSKTVVFFGSGPVGAASLEALAKSFSIEFVITKQRPVHHKGLVPVVEVAERLRLPVLFASTSSELEDVVSSQSFQSELGVLVDYGVLVSQEIIHSFSLGIINSHFSLLPQWRGADPITFTVLSGQKETGVSLMLIVEKLDEGQLIAQEKMLVEPAITTPGLTNQLVDKSNKMLEHYLPDYVAGNISPYDQPDNNVTYSRKLTKADGIIDWTKPAQQLEREVRAFVLWPKSQTRLAGKDIVITKSHVVSGTGESGVPLEKRKALVIATGKDALSIDNLKPAGKPEMTAQAFLAGYRHLL